MSKKKDYYGKYATNIFTEKAKKIIEGHKEKHEQNQPLFLYLAHLAVHSSNPYDPLQVPLAVERKFNYIKDIRRRKFAGMLSKLDESVGEIAKSLQKAGLLRNSIILFTTDNGGPAG